MDYKKAVIISFFSIIIGLIVGTIDALFGRVLIWLTEFRTTYNTMLIPFLPLAGVLIVFVYKKLGKNSEKGMSLIFAVGLEEEKIIPKRLVPLVIVSTWLTHLFGGSAGREGVAVQIGGTVAHNIGTWTRIKDSSKIFLITGMAAGFAGLFQTPVAAIFFAMEVLVIGALEYSALLPSILAAFVASYTSHVLGLEKFSVNLNLDLEINPLFILKILLLGIVFGMAGRIFAHSLSFSKKYFSNLFQNPYLKTFLIGCMLAVLLILFHQGRYSGLGTNIIQDCFDNNKIYWYDWIVKAILTIITLSIGFQGGEVTPLFSIGTSLGVVLAGVVGLPFEFAAALGYAALFGSSTNTFLAPMFIGAEVFGYEYLPYFFIVCALAYICNGNKTIYSAQRNL